MNKKSLDFLDKYILQLTIVLLTLGASLAVWTDYNRFDKLRLSFQIESSSSGFAQVFYDVGNGLNEADSVRVFVPGAAVFKEVNFDLPGNFINSLRIDPLDKPSKISIKEVKIQRAENNNVVPLGVDQFQAAAGIEGLRINSAKGESILTFNTNSADPQFEIKVKLPKDVTGANIFEKINYKKYALFLSIISLLIIFYCFEIKIFNCLWKFIKSNSIFSIFIFSLLSVAISSYPLFFGKSLNYAAGLPMLYESLGWMPGYEFDGHFENFRGSDVAAHSWSFSPMSKVIYESIFKFFEFPFWNRYVGGGIPLWAQGSYMVGDPLHWITIFFKASPYAWDAKFLLSKFIFVFGSGLLIKKLINEPVVSLIIVLAAPFIGFYTYAFNHPSYFNLTYLPLSLWAWVCLTNETQDENRRKFNLALRIFLVSFLTWLMLNAGATKESVITTALVTGWGLAYNFIALRKTLPLKRALFGTLLLSLALILVNSPFILLFLDALKNAATSYDAYSNDPYPTSLILGFFEPIYYQQYLKNYIGPSVNILFLYLLIGSINKNNILDIKYKITVFFSLICFVFSFGLVPDFIVLNIPLINRIHHTGITFSIPLILFIVVLSAYGAKSIFSNKKNQVIIDFLIILIVMSIANHIMIKFLNTKIWHIIYFLILSIFIYIYINFIRLRLQKFSSILNFLIVPFYIILTLLVLKNGLHIVSATNLDRYMTNPNVRMEIDNKSLAIDAIKVDIKRSGNPSRVLGDNLNFIPGVGHYYGLEAIGSAEPLKNPYLEDYYKINGIKAEPGWGWFRKYNAQHTSAHIEKFYDSLNVKYLLTTPGTTLPKELGNYKLLINADLDVYIRENAWPRAFYSNQVSIINNENEFVRLLNERKLPFVAIESSQENLNYINKRESVIIEAENYILTNNKTCFDIKADGAGFVVLNESYYPNDYELTVNDSKVKYFKVNIWQKGFKVNSGGNYHVCYLYKPKNIELSLILCFLGFILLFAYFINTIFKKTK
jgi:hypothetical protein